MYSVFHCFSDIQAVLLHGRECEGFSCRILCFIVSLFSLHRSLFYRGLLSWHSSNEVK